MPRKQKKPGKLFLLAVAGVAGLVLQVLPLFAGSIPADQVRISTPVYGPADSFNPLLGRYSYAVSWNGIAAASIELELNRSGDEYAIRASARTSKEVDLVYKLRYTSETVLAADTFKPKQSFSIDTTNSQKKITRLEFLPGGEIISIRRNQRGIVKTMKFNPDNFTLDPYSAGFLALSQEWKVGERRRFDVFNGKSRYLIEFSAVEKTKLTVNGKVRPAIVIVPTVKKLTASDDDAKDKKLREARIYISADRSREILKISSSLLFGSVEAEMVDFTPAPKAVSQDKTAAAGLKNRPIHAVTVGNF